MRSRQRLLLHALAILEEASGKDPTNEKQKKHFEKI